MDKNTQRRFDRQLLPKPSDYYANVFPALKINSEWVSVCCPFHEDSHPSLRLNMSSGGFYCFGCGAKGGDILAFHREYHAMGFQEAVTFFGAWCCEQ